MESPTNTTATYLSGGSGIYQHMRFSFAGTAISGYPNNIYHCQFVQCAAGINAVPP